MIFRLLGDPGTPTWVTFAERAAASCALPPGAGAFLGTLAANPNVLVLVGEEGAVLKCLLVCELPTPFTLLPTITLAYNEGSRDLRAQAFCALQRWVRAHGYEQVRMVNRSGHGAAYERALRPLGEVVERHELLTVKLREEGGEGAEVLTAGGRGLDAGA